MARKTKGLKVGMLAAIKITYISVLVKVSWGVHQPYRGNESAAMGNTHVNQSII